MITDHGRRARRIDLSIAAVLREITEFGGRTLKVALANLGPEGAYIRTSAKVPIGAKVRLGFRLDSYPLEFDVEADVRWQRDGPEAGIGVQFRELARYERNAIDDCCQRWLDEQRGGIPQMPE